MTERRGVRARGTACAAAMICVLVLAGAARADDSVAVLPPSRPTPHQLKVHAAIDLGLAAVYFASELPLKPYLAPDECRWCTPLTFDVPIRDALVWQDPHRADLISYVTGFAAPGVIGLTALFLEAHRRHDIRAFYEDTLDVVDAAVAVGLVNQGTKFAVGRSRPFVHFAPPGHVHDTDDNLSFFSGHTSLAFGVTFAAAHAAQRRGYRSAPWILAGGLAFSTATAYLRIAADKHYASDVLVGAVFGGLVGWYVPGWLHQFEVTVAPAPNGLAIVGTF
jgi:membrane-associated phospholipid phosphatase